jgi:hypothetical protein
MSNSRQLRNRRKREHFVMTPEVKSILDYLRDYGDDFPCPEYLLHAENQQAFTAIMAAVFFEGDYSPESFERAAKKTGFSVAFIQGGLNQLVSLGYDKHISEHAGGRTH